MEWIRVTDRLPKEGEVVLALTKNGRVNVNRMYIARDFLGTEITGIPEWHGSDTAKAAIIAWLPVPPFEELVEPYKKNRND